MLHIIAIVLLAIFLLSYGIRHATNVKIVWLDTLGALSALLGGVLFLIEAVLGLR